ncbi:opioid growth factor receptor conserved domain-containing protein [Nemania serpens]|nr:opioid growth factor receptor conserved domain-containing protein [Nemania serpens]
MLPIHLTRASNPATQRLVDFFDPVVKGRDTWGHTLDQILRWDDFRLQAERDYIQSLFPLPEKMGFANIGPLIDEQTMIMFRRSPQLRGGLMRALKRMLRLYGFDSQVKDGTAGRLIIAPLETDCGGWLSWLEPYNHNHPRITRIIRSLRLLGLPGAAWDLYRTFIDLYKRRGIIEQPTITLWTRALLDPVYKALDGTEVDWLRKYKTEHPDRRYLWQG